MQTIEIDINTSADTSAPIGPTAAVADALAAQLAESPPSAGVLDALAFERLSTAGLIDAVIAWEKLLRHAQAGMIRGLGALARDGAAAGDRRLAEIEVTAALAWAPTTAQNRIGEAEALTRLFPETVQMLADARISVEQARSMADLTCGLEDASAQAVEAQVLARMPGQSASVTRQAIRRAIVRADPEAAAKRHDKERTRRHVELRPEDDGMATLSFYLPAEVAQMAMRTLTTLAQTAKRKNRSDKRTLDQRRADVLPSLLQGATGATASAVPSALVSVVVNIETLLGLSHEPGHLDGYGPICPEQTRRIANAHRARWRFLLTSSDGTLVDASDRTYPPRAAVKRLSQLKYQRCTFPNCAMPAERCDLDHGLQFHLGGPSSVCNLGPICRLHHNCKSFGRWDFDRIGDTILWTSNRSSHTYASEPVRYPVAAVTAAPSVSFKLSQNTDM